MSAGNPIFNASRQEIGKIYILEGTDEMIRLNFNDNQKQKSKTFTPEEFENYKKSTGYMEEHELGQMNIFDY